MATAVETYHENGEWKNKHEGNDRASSTHGTKEEAIQAGKEAARKAGVEHDVLNETASEIVFLEIELKP